MKTKIPRKGQMLYRIASWLVSGKFGPVHPVVVTRVGLKTIRVSALDRDYPGSTHDPVSLEHLSSPEPGWFLFRSKRAAEDGLKRMRKVRTLIADLRAFGMDVPAKDLDVMSGMVVNGSVEDDIEFIGGHPVIWIWKDKIRTSISIYRNQNKKAVPMTAENAPGSVLCVRHRSQESAIGHASGLFLDAGDDVMIIRFGRFVLRINHGGDPEVVHSNLE